MGLFLKNLRSIFDPSIRAEATIETQIFKFRVYSNKYPERDRHAWLALMLKTRYPNFNEWTYYIETMQFSILSEKEAPIAFGIYIIYKEGPASALPYSKLYLNMMARVWELLRKKEFVDVWIKENPWTFKNQPWLVDVLRKGEELGIEKMLDIVNRGA